MVSHGDVPMSVMYTVLVPSFPGQWSPIVSEIPEYRSQQCSSARWWRWKCPRIFTQSTVALGRNVRRWAEWRFKMAITQLQLTTQARRQHASLPRMFLLPSRSLISPWLLWLRVFYSQSRIYRSFCNLQTPTPTFQNFHQNASVSNSRPKSFTYTLQRPCRYRA